MAYMHYGTKKGEFNKSKFMPKNKKYLAISLGVNILQFLFIAGLLFLRLGK